MEMDVLIGIQVSQFMLLGVIVFFLKRFINEQDIFRTETRKGIKDVGDKTETDIKEVNKTALAESKGN